mmetsp:Transcript_8907/g.32635  ORF Transcript_8907/g.32635 Transcript_8907/m.32635 type:complete len:683 (+) Transcript_8907:167-2215(+)
MGSSVFDSSSSAARFFISRSFSSVSSFAATAASSAASDSSSDACVDGTVAVASAAAAAAPARLTLHDPGATRTLRVDLAVGPRDRAGAAAAVRALFPVDVHRRASPGGVGSVVAALGSRDVLVRLRPRRELSTTRSRSRSPSRPRARAIAIAPPRDPLRVDLRAHLRRDDARPLLRVAVFRARRVVALERRLHLAVAPRLRPLPLRALLLPQRDFHRRGAPGELAIVERGDESHRALRGTREDGGRLGAVGVIQLRRGHLVRGEHLVELVARQVRRDVLRVHVHDVLLHNLLLPRSARLLRFLVRNLVLDPLRAHRLAFLSRQRVLDVKRQPLVRPLDHRARRRLHRRRGRRRVAEPNDGGRRKEGGVLHQKDGAHGAVLREEPPQRAIVEIFGEISHVQVGVLVPLAIRRGRLLFTEFSGSLRGGGRLARVPRHERLARRARRRRGRRVLSLRARRGVASRLESLRLRVLLLSRAALAFGLPPPSSSDILILHVAAFLRPLRPAGGVRVSRVLGDDLPRAVRRRRRRSPANRLERGVRVSPRPEQHEAVRAVLRVLALELRALHRVLLGVVEQLREFFRVEVARDVPHEEHRLLFAARVGTMTLASISTTRRGVAAAISALGALGSIVAAIAVAARDVSHGLRELAHLVRGRVAKVVVVVARGGGGRRRLRILDFDDQILG